MLSSTLKIGILKNSKGSLKKPRKVEDKWTLSYTGANLSQSSLNLLETEVIKEAAVVAMAVAEAAVVATAVVEAAVAMVVAEAAAMVVEAEVKAMEEAVVVALMEVTEAAAKVMEEAVVAARMGVAEEGHIVENIMLKVN